MKRSNMIAIAKKNYKFSPIEKWSKGKMYKMKHNKNVIELEADGNYIGHWSEAAFEKIRHIFEIVDF